MIRRHKLWFTVGYIAAVLTFTSAATFILTVVATAPRGHY